MIKAFPKIFAIGSDYIRDLFTSEVEITEKVDGSQFVFGKVEGTLYMRSRGKQIFPEAPDKMFNEAVSYVCSIEGRIPDNTIYYCEYLKSPKHNVLRYARTPRNHLILFGVSDHTDRFISKHSHLIDLAEDLGIEAVPVLFHGKIDNVEQIRDLLDRVSVLGEVKIEGVVAKNYTIPFLLGGQPIPLMAGKYVSEGFKEVHREKWGSEFTTRGKWEVFLESFRTEARWHKAIQHLAEGGVLENSPRDIGHLIKEIHNDVEAEEKESIKNFLWNHFKGDIQRKAVAGFPEWYKQRLLERAVENSGS
jgi:hypothetical protein